MTGERNHFSCDTVPNFWQCISHPSGHCVCKGLLLYSPPPLLVHFLLILKYWNLGLRYCLSASPECPGSSLASRASASKPLHRAECENDDYLPLLSQQVHFGFMNGTANGLKELQKDKMS